MFHLMHNDQALEVGYNYQTVTQWNNTFITLFVYISYSYAYASILHHMSSSFITFSTFLVIFPKELGMMRRMGHVELLDVLLRLW